jgi:hypothetical protein
MPSSLVNGGIQSTTAKTNLVGSIDNGRSLRVWIITEFQDGSVTNDQLNGRGRKRHDDNTALCGFVLWVLL